MLTLTPREVHFADGSAELQGEGLLSAGHGQSSLKARLCFGSPIVWATCLEQQLTPQTMQLGLKITLARMLDDRQRAGQGVQSLVHLSAGIQRLGQETQKIRVHHRG